MTRFQTILFDLDGTLVDSYAALAKAINHARASSDLAPLPKEVIQGFVGEGVEMLLQRAFDGKEPPENARELFEAKYDEICCAESHVLAEVRATLERLSELGRSMAVCTNKPTGFSKKILQHLGLAPFFVAVIGPDVAGARKPDRNHVLRAMAAASGAPDDTLFVGDMPIDIAAARNSGMAVAVLPTGSTSEEALRAAKPDYLLHRFSELLAIV